MKKVFFTSYQVFRWNFRGWPSWGGHVLLEDVAVVNRDVPGAGGAVLCKFAFWPRAVGFQLEAFFGSAL